MSYIVLARKWRPIRFEDLIGQEHVARTLGNAIRIDRLAHAFLFTGVRGVGKTSAARILAMCLNCESTDGPTSTPCGTCTSCTRIAGASSMDVQEIDGASNNSVEDVRHLRETVAFQPSHSRMKVYIIDEVHMLSTSAFNALLKTLEEPPPHVKFIFATTEPHRIPVTILSRCQRYDFRRIPPGRIAEHLSAIAEAESVSIQPDAVTMVAREAQGSMRDALSLLDQVLAAFGDEVTLENVSWLMGVADHRVHLDLTRHVIERQPEGCLEIIGRLDRDGYNLAHFTDGYLEHVRDLVVVKSVGAGSPRTEVAQGEAGDIEKVVAETPLPELYRIFTHVARAADEIARAPRPRILLEMTFLKLAQNEPLTTVARLLQALGDIKRQGGLDPSSSGGTRSNRGGSAGGRRGPDARGDRAGTVEPRPAEGPSVDGPPPDRGAAGPRTGAGEPETVEAAEDPVPGDVKSTWNRIVEEAACRSTLLGRVLGKATPLTIGDTEVHVGFDGQSEVGSSIVCEKENIASIEEACSTVLGRPVHVRIEKDSDVARKASSARLERKRREQERLRKSARMHPVVQSAQDVLGARITDIKTDVE